MHQQQTFNNTSMTYQYILTIQHDINAVVRYNLTFMSYNSHHIYYVRWHSGIITLKTSGKSQNIQRKKLTTLLRKTAIIQFLRFRVIQNLVLSSISY